MSSKKKKGTKNNIKLDSNTYLILNLMISCLFLCLLFIKGENMWHLIRLFFLGVFGINAIFLPIFLISYTFLKLKNGEIDKFKCSLWCIFSVVSSSLIGIFSFQKDNSFLHYYQLGISSSGIVSGTIDILLVKCFGLTASVAILIILWSFVSIILFKIDISKVFEKIKIFFLSCNNAINDIKIFTKKEKKLIETSPATHTQEVVNSTSLNN